MTSRHNATAIYDQIGVPAFEPDQHVDCEMWYKYNTNQILSSGTTNCESWKDATYHSRHMLQATTAEKPQKDTGEDFLTFDSSVDSNLQTATTLDIDGEFVIGMRVNIETTNGTILGSNTTAGELIKIASTVNMIVKIDNTARTITLEGETFGDDYLVLARDGDDIITLYRNGDPVEDTAVLSGTLDIDCMGIRATDTNGFDGDIYDISVFSTYDEQLVSDLNGYLSKIAP